MQVHVFVSVDMVEREAGRMKSLELRTDFGSKPAASAGDEGDAQCSAEQIIAKRAVAAPEAAELILWQYRPAIDQHQVQTNSQRSEPSRPRHRIRARRRADHQAGGGQDAVTIG